MSKTTFAAPRRISRRGFLAGSAALGTAMTLPAGAFAQQEGQLLLWLPGGSDLFCKIHTGLLEGFSTGAGLGTRLGNSIRLATYPKGSESLNAAALVWSNAPVIVGAHDTGPLIRSRMSD